jgi:DNA-binding GntR family transcriptional regulator
MDGAEMVKLTNKKNKSETAYQQVRQLIAEGFLSPGERIKETEIAEKIGVSRGIVRESLFRLEAEGVIKYRGNCKGRYLEFLEDQDIGDVLQRYELREIIESGAARLAAMNMNGHQIEELRRYATEYVACSQSNDDAGRKEAARQFHRFLLMSCGNGKLLEVWDTFNLAPVATRAASLEARILKNIPDGQAQDEKLMAVVQAIASHHPDLAEKEMRTFVQNVTQAIRKVAMEQA